MKFNQTAKSLSAAILLTAIVLPAAHAGESLGAGLRGSSQQTSEIDYSVDSDTNVARSRQLGPHGCGTNGCARLNNDYLATNVYLEKSIEVAVVLAEVAIGAIEGLGEAYAAITGVLGVFSDEYDPVVDLLDEMWRNVNHLVSETTEDILKDNLLNHLKSVADHARDATIEFDDTNYDQVSLEIEEARQGCDEFIEGGGWPTVNGHADAVRLPLLWKVCDVCMSTYTLAKEFGASEEVPYQFTQNMEREFNKLTEQCSIEVTDAFLDLASQRIGQVQDVELQTKGDDRCHKISYTGRWSLRALDEGTNEYVVEWKDRGTCESNGFSDFGYGKDRFCPGMGVDAETCVDDYRKSLSRSLYDSYNQVLFPEAKAYASLPHIADDAERNRKAQLIGGKMIRSGYYGRCISANPDSLYQYLGSQECSGEDDQVWMFHSDGRIHSKLDLTRCLDALDGTLVRWNPCNDNDGQKWTVQEDSTITNHAVAGCLTPLQSYVRLSESSCNKESSQWKVMEVLATSTGLMGTLGGTKTYRKTCNNGFVTGLKWKYQETYKGNPTHVGIVDAAIECSSDTGNFEPLSSIPHGVWMDAVQCTSGFSHLNADAILPGESPTYNIFGVETKCVGSDSAVRSGVDLAGSTWRNLLTCETGKNMVGLEIYQTPDGVQNKKGTGVTDMRIICR